MRPELFADQRDPMRRRKALRYDPGESPDDLKKLIGDLTVQYVQCKRPKADKEPAVSDEAAHEKDDTMGHRTLAALLRTGKNRIRRVIHTYGITAQSLRKKYVYPGEATELAPNKLREEAFEWVGNQVVFSDMLEVKRADGTGVRGCFELCHRTGQILLIAFDNHMRADLVTDAIEIMAFEVPGSIWHSEEGKHYGAVQTHSLLLHKGGCRSP
jgi:putative transposase